MNELSKSTRDVIDDVFDTFLSALNSNERSNRAVYEDNRRDYFTRWAAIIQGAYAQFKIIQKVFQQIEEATDTWVVEPIYVSNSNVPLLVQDKNDRFYRTDLPEQKGNKFYIAPHYGYGYQFHMEITEHPNFTREKRDKLRRVYTTGRDIPSNLDCNPHKSICIEYGFTDIREQWWGKIPEWQWKQGLGVEEKFCLPPFYALHHDKVDERTVVEYIKSHKDLPMRVILPGGEWAIAMRRGQNWTELFDGHNYDLRGFYETSLEGMVQKCQLHPVTFDIVHDTRNNNTSFLRMNIYSFLQLDIESIIKLLFMKLNQGELKNLEKYLPAEKVCS